LSLPTKLYRRKVENLHQALNADDTRAEATETLRGFIGTNTKTP
jgi:hypothetical protein